jgi:hypothetical protein
MGVTVRRRPSGETFWANCPSNILVGDMVRISGVKIGEYYQVSLCNIDAPDNRTVGMVVEKLSPVICLVRVSGVVDGVYSGLIPGKHLFINNNARLSHTPPPAVSSKRYVENAGMAISDNVVLLAIKAPLVMAQI